MTITGLSFSVASFFSLSQSALYEAVFAGDDIINGTPLGDSLTGYAGANTINGAGGDDLITSLSSSDTIDGGDGVDRILIERLSGANVSVSLAGMNAASGITLSDGTSIRNVESFGVTTGSGADTLTFSGPIVGLNTFNAGGGVDQVEST